MVGLNLTVNYTLLAPSKIVSRIEALNPCAAPERSPIAEVRTRWRLEKMGVDELRKAVLDGERRGVGSERRDERDWLIGILMGEEGLGRGVRMESVDAGLGLGFEVKDEVVEGMGVGGGKRRRDDDDDNDDDGERRMEKIKKV